MKKSLTQWLEYIASLNPKTIALGLDRIRTVAERLSIWPINAKVITVGGTNGKGSCVTFLESMLSEAGYRVGAYLSPHLVQFNERIRLNQTRVSHVDLLSAFEQIEKVCESIQLTYFEFTTLAALILFKQAALDVWVLEIGLGGRLDAVNIIDSDVSVITSIALDHMDWLGDTLEAIAYEKAGIFRTGKPAVCGDDCPPQSLFKVALEKKVPLFCLKKDFNFALDPREKTWSWQCPSVHYNALPIPSLSVQNAATAIMALVCLQQQCGLTVSQTAIVRGLEKAFIAGRCQVMPYEAKRVILDVAHNPASAEHLALWLEKQTSFEKTTWALVGMLSDKDILGTLKPLLPWIQRWCVVSLEEARGASAQTIANNLQTLGVNAYHIQQSTSVLSGLKQTIAQMTRQDRVVVFGSFHTVGPVLEHITCRS